MDPADLTVTGKPKNLVPIGTAFDADLLEDSTSFLLIAEAEEECVGRHEPYLSLQQRVRRRGCRLSEVGRTPPASMEISVAEEGRTPFIPMNDSVGEVKSPLSSYRRKK